jgi:hypothetical protein
VSQMQHSWTELPEIHCQSRYLRVNFFP